MFATQMKKFIIASILSVLSILIVVTFIFVRLRESLITYELVTFDASPLYDELSGCNMVRVFNEEGIIYESRDVEEVTQVIDSIIVNTNSVRTLSLSRALCTIGFFRDDEPVVRLHTKSRSRLHWTQSQATWDWTFDFWLTNESYRKLVFWFSEKTGKSEEDLFFPHSDDDGWEDPVDDIMQKNKYEGKIVIVISSGPDGKFGTHDDVETGLR